MVSMLMLFFTLQTLISNAQAERPQPPQTSAYRIGAGAEYYQTTHNFDSQGESRKLIGDGDFSTVSGELNASYDWNRMFRTSAFMSFANARSNGTPTLLGPGSFNNLVARSNTGINELGTSVQAWLPVDVLHLAAEAGVRYPLWSVNEDADQPLIGEGAGQYNLGLWAIAKTKPVQPFGYLGFTYRDAGRSSLLPYAVGAHLQVRQWWAEASWYGQFTVMEDADTQNRAMRDYFVNRVDAGSYRFYAVNPTLHNLQLQTGFQFGPFGLLAGFSTSMMGNNAADGWAIHGGLSFSSEIFSKPAANTGADPRFQLQQDKYDESLFQENSAAPPQEPKKIRRKVRQKPSVEKMMHEAEKELQKEN